MYPLYHLRCCPQPVTLQEWAYSCKKRKWTKCFHLLLQKSINVVWAAFFATLLSVRDQLSLEEVAANLKIKVGKAQNWERIVIWPFVFFCHVRRMTKMRPISFSQQNISFPPRSFLLRSGSNRNIFVDKQFVSRWGGGGGKEERTIYEAITDEKLCGERKGVWWLARYGIFS